MEKQLNREYIIKVLQEHRDLLKKNFYVKRIGLFGSFARDEGNEQSDIDFVVEFDAPLAIYIKNRYSLNDYLHHLFNRDVDLANPDSLKPFYKQEILSQVVYA